MTDQAIIIGISGIILALIGIGFSYISYQKTKDFEKRLREKERIKEFTKQLLDMIQHIRWNYIEPIKKPLSCDGDVSNFL